ncbi:MAG TPA: YggS family pyridoxal phosphate-dependent enzyme [Gemmatimonadales bacterium]|jgi:pyridoxal phosphate enzyme (YggS family)|nr:YggS family pyridoxal phosphate-dependent enzyme [Gemmatimonadales bacterium]
MDFEPLGERLRVVREEIAVRQSRGGWRHPVRIIAVTKTFGAQAVRAAVREGLDAVGENRVQEALAKQADTADVAVEWHLIGTLQRNKVRQATGRFALVHSVDRAELADEISRRAGTTPQDVLVQVNCSAEPQKGGVEPAALPPLLEHLRTLEGVRLRGLMTMAAADADESEQHRTFALLRTLRDASRADGHYLPELSMGMSGDFPVAVEEGATMLRLGTILFGSRQP